MWMNKESTESETETHESKLHTIVEGISQLNERWIAHKFFSINWKHMHCHNVNVRPHSCIEYHKPTSHSLLLFRLNYTAFPNAYVHFIRNWFEAAAPPIEMIHRKKIAITFHWIFIPFSLCKIICFTKIKRFLYIVFCRQSFHAPTFSRTAQALKYTSISIAMFCIAQRTVEKVSSDV